MFKVSIVSAGVTQEFENEFTTEQLMIFLKLCVNEFRADEINITRV